MALDKWQQRQVAEYARDNDVTEEAALKELFPDEVPTAARRVASPKAAADKDKAPAAADKDKAPAS